MTCFISQRIADRQSASGRRRCRVLQAALFALATAGCVSLPATPQSDPPNATSDAQYAVFVVGHGRHTGLVVKRAALSSVLPTLGEASGDAGGSRRYLEMGWGDEQFYRDPEPGTWDGLRAIAWPTESTLHIVEFDADPHERFARAELLEVRLSATQHDRLLHHVAQQFVVDEAGTPVRIGEHHAGHGTFYRASGKFHLFRTCNTWLAGTFEAAGLPVNDRLTITSEGVLEQLRPLALDHAAGDRPTQHSDR